MTGFRLRRGPTRIARLLVVLALFGAAMASTSCGKQTPSDAPTAVPAALQPRQATRDGLQQLYLSYTAQGTSDDSALGYPTKLSNWYKRRLARSVTEADSQVVAFRRYRGRYSGRIAFGRVGVRLPSNVPVMGVVVTLDNRRSSLTRAPSDFPLHPDMEEASWLSPALRQSYRPARRGGETQAKAIAFYRGVLGRTITGQGEHLQGSEEKGDYVLEFKGFKSMSGAVVVRRDGRVTLELQRAGS